MPKSTTKPKSRKASGLQAVPKKPKYLTETQLEELAAVIVCTGDDPEQKTSSLILLMDELERAQFDRLQVENICFTVKKAAFTRSDVGEKALDEFVKKLRAA